MNRKNIFAALIVCALLYLAGPDERQDERNEYCKNVAAGYWPDYDAGRFEAECGGKKPPKFNKDF